MQSAQWFQVCENTLACWHYLSKTGHDCCYSLKMQLPCAESRRLSTSPGGFQRLTITILSNSSSGLSNLLQVEI